MNQELISNIAKLRTCVAYLGENEQHNWWSSSFLSHTGEAFLNPVFPKTSFMARVNGAGAAAQLVHDEHIGIGDVHHLFRLSETIEHQITQLLSKDYSADDCIGSDVAAISQLKSLANEEIIQGVGPLLLDQNDINNTVIKLMASAYLVGFENNEAVFPFYRGLL